MYVVSSKDVVVFLHRFHSVMFNRGFFFFFRIFCTRFLQKLTFAIIQDLEIRVIDLIN